MKTKTLTISVLLLAMVLAPMALAADEPAPRGPRGGYGGPGRGGLRGGPGMGGDMMGRMAQFLNLTEEQQEKIKAIHEEYRPKIQEAQQTVQEARQAVEEAIESGSDDEIMAAAKTLGEAIGNQGILKAQSQRKTKEVLTPEQQEKWEQMKKRRQEQMQQMRENRREGEGTRGPGGRPGGRGPGGRGPRGGGRRGPGRN